MTLPVSVAGVAGVALAWSRARAARARRAALERLVAEQRAHLVRLEEQVRRAQKLDTIGQLASGIAHDFNNLLTAVSASAEFLTEALPPGHAALEDVAVIREATRRAAAVTRQLLAFARRPAAEPRTLDLNGVVAGMLDLTRRLLGPEVVLCWSPSATPLPVRMDQAQLEQVFLNLAVNAAEAMPDGGRLRVSSATAVVEHPQPYRHGVLPPGAYAVLAVCDTGGGMDEATLARLFEPFFTTKPAGTGLGLATVLQATVLAGGHVLVESTPGAGSRFAVHLPLDQASPDRQPS